MNKKENKIFQEMEALRKEKYVKPKKMMIIYTPFIVLTFIALMPITLLILLLASDSREIIKTIEEIMTPEFLIFLGISTVIFIIFMIFRHAYIKKSKLREDTRRKLSLQLNEIFINNKDDNLNFESSKKEDETGQKNLTPFNFYSNSKILNRNIILGNYKNIDFTISNIEFKREKKKLDPSAATELWEIVFYIVFVSIKNAIVKLFDIIRKGKIKGRLYVYKFNEKHKDEIRIVERFGIKGFSLRKGNFKKIETEMLGFNKKFKIYSSNEKLYYKLINARIVEKMYRLKKLHKGKVYCCYKENELYFFINNKCDFSYVNLDKPIIENQVNDYFKEDMKLIHEIIDDFELTSLKNKI